MSSKKASETQNYDDEYWELTLEYTDIHSERFRGTLEIIRDFYNQHHAEITSSGFTVDLNKKLQEQVNTAFPKKDMGSARKAINQFIKLGFVNSGFTYIHPDVDAFLDAKTNRRRRTLFSKIVYENSHFRNSTTKDKTRGGELNLLIKTLEEVGKLCQQDISGLMLADVNKYPAGFLTEEELNQLKSKSQTINPALTTEKHPGGTNFIQRKHNQIKYLPNVLQQLDGLTLANDKCFYFSEDAKREFPQEQTGRDNYQHLLMKNALQEEVEEKKGKMQCMVEEIAYPVLINSHIKPWKTCDDEYYKSHKEDTVINPAEHQGYDPSNGLLISENLDGMFDKGNITFDENGKIVFSDEIDESVQTKYKDMSISEEFLTTERKENLKWHRENKFKK